MIIIVVRRSLCSERAHIHSSHCMKMGLPLQAALSSLGSANIGFNESSVGDRPRAPANSALNLMSLAILWNMTT